jgi:hypothetical protein
MSLKKHLLQNINVNIVFIISLVYQTETSTIVNVSLKKVPLDKWKLNWVLIHIYQHAKQNVDFVIKYYQGLQK